MLPLVNGLGIAAGVLILVNLLGVLIFGTRTSFLVGAVGPLFLFGSALLLRWHWKARLRIEVGVSADAIQVAGDSGWTLPLNEVDRISWHPGGVDRNSVPSILIAASASNGDPALQRWRRQFRVRRDIGRDLLLIPTEHAEQIVAEVTRRLPPSDPAQR